MAGEKSSQGGAEPAPFTPTGTEAEKNQQRLENLDSLLGALTADMHIAEPPRDLDKPFPAPERLEDDR